MFKRIRNWVKNLFKGTNKADKKGKAKPSPGPSPLPPTEFTGRRSKKHQYVIDLYGLDAFEQNGQLRRMQKTNKGWIYKNITDKELDFIYKETLKMEKDTIAFKDQVNKIKEFVHGVGTSASGSHLEYGLALKVGSMNAMIRGSIEGYRNHLLYQLDHRAGLITSEQYNFLVKAINQVDDVLNINDIEHYNQTSDGSYLSINYLISLLHASGIISTNDVARMFPETLGSFGKPKAD